MVEVVLRQGMQLYEEVGRRMDYRSRLPRLICLAVSSTGRAGVLYI